MLHPSGQCSEWREVVTHGLENERQKTRDADSFRQSWAFETSWLDPNFIGKAQAARWTCAHLEISTMFERVELLHRTFVARAFLRFDISGLGQIPHHPIPNCSLTATFPQSFASSLCSEIASISYIHVCLQHIAHASRDTMWGLFSRRLRLINFENRVVLVVLGGKCGKRHCVQSDDGLRGFQALSANCGEETYSPEAGRSRLRGPPGHSGPSMTDSTGRACPPLHPKHGHASALPQP